MYTLELRLLWLCVLALYSASWANGQECMRREAQDRKQCFYTRNLDMTRMPNNLEVLMPAYESYESFFTWMDPNVYCDRMPEYKEALDCAVNISMSCFDPDGTQGTLPTVNSMFAGMQRLCEVKDQVDAPCFKTFFNAAADCANYNFQKLNINILRATIKELTCTQGDLMYDCFELLSKPLCGENSTNIYLQQLGNYQMPSLCSNGSEPTRERVRYFAELNPPVSGPTTDNGANPIITNALTTTMAVLSTSAVAVVALILELSFGRFSRLWVRRRALFQKKMSCPFP